MGQSKDCRTRNWHHQPTLLPHYTRDSQEFHSTIHFRINSASILRSTQCRWPVSSTDQSHQCMTSYRVKQSLLQDIPLAQRIRTIQGEKSLMMWDSWSKDNQMTHLVEHEEHQLQMQMEIGCSQQHPICIPLQDLLADLLKYFCH